MANLRSTSALASLATLVFGSACVGQGELAGPPYEVVVLDRVNSATDSQSSDESSAADPIFALRRRSLETLDDFERLSAPAFRIRQGGTLNVDRMHGDNITSGLFEGGNDPDLRYVVQDGVALPRDYSTLLMFSAAYQFERVSESLRAATTSSVRAALDSHGSLDAIFAPTIQVRVEGVEASLLLDTNAFFFADGWQFGLAQSSPRELAPLAADARVIAHELGHAVFQLSFFEGQTSKCDAQNASDNEDDPWFEGRLEGELAIGGLNEGFADWMSFAVTGGTNPLESIAERKDPKQNEHVPERVLTDDNFHWSEIVKDDDDDAARADRLCSGKYCLGTLFARSLVATYLEHHALDDEAARHEFSVDVVSALDQAQSALRALTLPVAEAKVARCDVRDEVSSEYDPPVIGAFLEAFLRGVPADSKAALCSQLIERFATGFPSEYRKECQP